MKRVGLMCGREYAFPPAFIEKVNELGAGQGVVGEFVKLGGTYMGEASRYAVIVDRISHEVDYYRAFLKHAMLNGTYVINNPFWWTADDKFFNYSVVQKLGVTVPKTVLLPQKGYPWDVDIQQESLRNLDYPLDWDAILEYIGLPAILKPFSGGGWKHVYKIHNKEELWAAYDGTSPYCMTLQEFIDFDHYVRCFTFGKSDIMPVAYDPKDRKYLVIHDYLAPELGERVVRDAQIDQRGARLRDEHGGVRHQGRRAVRDRLPEPGARFRARPHHPVLLRHRRREDGAPRDRSRRERRAVQQLAEVAVDGESEVNPIDAWHGALRPEDLTASAFGQLSARMRAERLTFGDRVHCPFLRPLFLTDDDERRIREFAETIAVLGERVVAAAMAGPALLDELGLRPDERRLVDIDPGYARASTSSRVDTFLLPDSLQAAEYNAESPAGFGYTERLAGVFEQLPVMAALQGRVRRAGLSAHGDHARRAHDELPRVGRPRAAADHRHRGLAQRADLERVRNPPGAVHQPRRADDRLHAGGPRVRRARVARAGAEDRPALPARAHQRHHEPPGRVRRSRARVRGEGRVHGQLVPLQDSPQEGVLRRADRSAARRALQRAGASDDRAPRALDTRRRRDQDVERRGHVRPGPVDPAEPRRPGR